MFKNFNNLFIPFLLFHVVFSCQKKQETTFDFEEMTNLDNYSLTKERLNDSVSKIKGKNKYFTIEGDFNERKSSKIKWWTFASVDNNLKYEIEYINLGKEESNQIKIFEKNGLVEHESLFYDVKFSEDSCVITAFFPQDEKFRTSSVDMYYIFGDSISRTKKEESHLKLKGNHHKYIFKLKRENSDNLISGYISEFSESKKAENDSILLSSRTMFFFKRQ